MINRLTPNLPLQTLPPGIQTCRHQNQHWAATLAQNEQEIDQLLSLLANLPEHHSYRSLHHPAVDYSGSLNLLKMSFQQLRLDMVCEGMTCTLTERQTCQEPRFGVYTLIERHCRPLTDEFNRVRDEYYQFLTCLMTLNLI
ncbi:hypothetical protein [Spirosoma areae]